MTDTTVINRMADAWSRDFGLVRYEPYFGQQTLAPLFGRADLERVGRAETAHHGYELLDHSRAFKPRGRGNGMPTVMVSAPYEHRLRERLGTRTRVTEEIYALADALGLRVRVGHPADRIYDSAPSGRYPVLPIVWWDSARFTLAYSPVPDPIFDADDD